MGKITEKSTKAQIMDAYTQALAELEKLKAMSDSPVENAKKEALEASMQNAEVAASNEVFSDTIVKQYNDLKIAIDEYQKELEGLYGIKAEADGLAAAINAHRAKTYLDKISSSVVVSALNKIINNIVFGKKLENKKLTKAQSNLEAARYLQFCIDYALEHKIPITHAPGLYYLIDNVRVKKAYEKKNELEMQKEMKKQMDVEIESKPVDTTVKPTTNFSAGSGNFGFGNILGGMNE